MSEPRGDLADAFDGDVDLPDTVDRAAVRRMRAVARLLDESIRVPGTDYRIGIDPIVGLLPGSGDALGALLSMYIVAESARLGVSYATLFRMLANVSLDTAGGMVPYVGTLFDAAWKANKRNVNLALDDLTRGSSDGDDGPVVIEVE